MTGMDKCELCNELIDWCACHRCMDCEELFAATEDDDPECPRCGGEPI